VKYVLLVLRALAMEIEQVTKHFIVLPRQRAGLMNMLNLGDHSVQNVVWVFQHLPVDLQ
jgi:hypothetical protein